jgi:hypothetical protein
MQIFVKLCNSKTVTIDVEPTTILKDIVELVYKKGGLPPGYQRYVYSGKPLNSELTIYDYDVQKESTIHEFYKPITRAF